MNPPVDASNAYQATLSNEILGRYQPNAATLKLGQERPLASELLDRLMLNEQYDGAIDFLNYWLTAPQAVWWSCLCFWDCHRGRDIAPCNSALPSITRWLSEPSQDNRQVINLVQQELPSSEPLGLIAKAAWFSGGNIAPLGLPAVMPTPYLHSAFCSGAIKLLLAQSPPVDYLLKAKQYLEIGMDVLRGTNRFP